MKNEKNFEKEIAFSLWKKEREIVLLKNLVSACFALLERRTDGRNEVLGGQSVAASCN